MNRQQKIDFLNRLIAGKASLQELQELPPLGMIIKEDGGYKLGDKLLTEEELEKTLKPYTDANKYLNGVPVIYSMIVQ